MPDFAVISDHDLLCHCHGETDGGAAHAAFGELARRHVDFVYGVARRQVRDPHLAADVTQTVLLVLARKAAAVRSPQQLPGWLFQTTRYAAANALRQQARRARHERAAATLRHEAARPVGGLLTDLEAPLNDALARLPANERDAILLRFFKDTDYADLAQKLSITESAARKRVSRGVERLRAELSRHLPAGAGGVAPAAVVGLLTAAAAEKAPAALVATAAAATPAAALIGKGTLMALAVSPLKAAAAALAALVIAALVGGGIYSFAKRPSAAAPVGPATQTAQVAWLTNAATHRFADGTVAGVLVVGDMMTGQWWHADGTPAHMPALATPQLVRDGAVIKLRPDKRYIGVATTAVRGESNLYYVTSLTSGERALTPTIFSDGGSEMPCYVNVFEIDPATERLSLRVRASTSPTETAVQIDAGPDGAWDPQARSVATVERAGTFAVGSPREIDGKATFDFSHPSDSGPASPFDALVVAEGVKGGLTTHFAYTPADNAAPMTATFDQPLAEVRSVRVRIVRYDHWVEVRDVSLKSGTASKVTIASSEDVPPPLSHRFDDGTSVTLLGVSDNADAGANKRWWRADGGPLPKGPYPQIGNRLGPTAVELPLRLTGTDAEGKEWTNLNMLWSSSGQQLGWTWRFDGNKQRLPGEHVLLGNFGASDRTSLTLRFARHPREDALVLPVPAEADESLTADVPGVGRIELGRPREVDGFATITAKVPKPPPHIQVVIGARDVTRRAYVAPRGPSPTVGGTDGLAADITFSTRLDALESFYIGVRTYGRRVVFHDVAVKPGVDTAPTVTVHEDAPEK